MQRTTRYNRGEVVLVNFVFAEGTGARRRPAIVLTTEAYNAGRQEAIVAAVTSNTQRLLIGDYVIKDWEGAGLLLPSVATGIIRTIKQSMITRRLGTMTLEDMQSIEDRLKANLGLV